MLVIVSIGNVYLADLIVRIITPHLGEGAHF